MVAGTSPSESARGEKRYYRMKKHGILKKTLCVFLSLLMTAAMIPAVTLVNLGVYTANLC